MRLALILFCDTKGDRNLVLAASHRGLVFQSYIVAIRDK